MQSILMKPLQYVGVCVFAVLGGAAGSFLVQPALLAHAQNRIPQQPLPQVQETLIVPSDGLRLMSQGGRVLGAFVPQAGGLSLVLLNASGQPGVTITAGAGGVVQVGASSDSSGIIAVNSAGVRASLVTNSTGGALTLGPENRQVKMAGGENALLSIPGRGSSPVLQLKSVSDGGQLQISSRTGRTLIDLITNAEYGRMTLEGSRANTSSAAEVNGLGSLQLRKGGKQVWSAGELAPGDPGTGGPPGSTGGGI